MPETSQSPYLNYNQTPNHASDFFSTPETYDLVQQVIAEGSPVPQLSSEQETQTGAARERLESVTYPEELLNLGARLNKLRSDKEVYNN